MPLLEVALGLGAQDLSPCYALSLVFISLVEVMDTTCADHGGSQISPHWRSMEVSPIGPIGFHAIVGVTRGRTDRKSMVDEPG